jgi:hypothetical protein
MTTQARIIHEIKSANVSEDIKQAAELFETKIWENTTIYKSAEIIAPDVLQLTLRGAKITEVVDFSQTDLATVPEALAHTQRALYNEIIMAQPNYIGNGAFSTAYGEWPNLLLGADAVSMANESVLTTRYGPNVTEAMLTAPTQHG